MQGIVKGISRNKQRMAILTEHGYTVFDIRDGEACMGDMISGCLDDHGEQDLTNLSSGHRLCVYIEAIQASKESAQSLLSHR
ncbi:hypothetical protein [Methylomonas sp. HYX-M1]|uniref:hypothetical protein n=1 Tax=Methylomonas sp. HYX-M1 TaxID=3139307 RepID=UPI00345C16E8